MKHIEISGKVSKDVLIDLKNFKSSLLSREDLLIAFVMRNDFDIPLGTLFSREISSLSSVPKTGLKLTAVTQQYDFLWNEIPRGWNCICAFESTDKDFKNVIPFTRDWCENTDRLKMYY